MLSPLCDYADKNLSGIEPGFARKQVKWVLCCDENGRYTGLINLGEDTRGRWFDKSPVTPNMNSGGKSHFLAETLETVTLFGQQELEEKKQLALQNKNHFFCDLLIQADESIPALKAAATLLQDSQQLAQIHADIEAKGNKIKLTDIVTFRINEAIPLQSDNWYEWWRCYYLQATEEKNKTTKTNNTRCLISGELITPLESHPKIKGLAGVGGQASGDVIVGMDKGAFQSYGFKKSQNAAMSEQVANKYVAALNFLIEQNGSRLGNSIITHWYKETLSAPVEDDPLAWLETPPENQEAGALLASKKMLNAIQSGERPDLANNQYYALMLSGAAGRVMIRDWIEGSFTDLVKNINQWFDDFSIIARDGNKLTQAPKFMAVAGALVRDLKDLPAPQLQQLWHTAINNSFIPYNALSQATLRARIDIINNNSPLHARMGLIKAYHCRKGDKHMQPNVNPQHPEAAYHCGRLLAILARLQYAALGDVGAGVIQRYYTATSQTPALLIGRLIANAKNHLNKLEGGLGIWYEDKIAETMSALGDSIPKTLTLEKQSLFALGYYQQLAERKKNEHCKPLRIFIFI